LDFHLKVILEEIRCNVCDIQSGLPANNAALYSLLEKAKEINFIHNTIPAVKRTRPVAAEQSRVRNDLHYLVAILPAGQWVATIS
jgi:hypothetical protein